MKTYSIMIRGENCLIKVNGQLQKCGFFVTRTVTASNTDEAFDAVKFSLYKELNGTALNPAEDALVMHLEEINEGKAVQEHRVLGRGFTWFNDSEE